MFVCLCAAEEKAGVCGKGGEDAAGPGSAPGSVREERTAGAPTPNETGTRAGVSTHAAGNAAASQRRPASVLML